MPLFCLFSFFGSPVWANLSASWFQSSRTRVKEWKDEVGGSNKNKTGRGKVNKNALKTAVYMRGEGGGKTKFGSFRTEKGLRIGEKEQLQRLFRQIQ